MFFDLEKFNLEIEEVNQFTPSVLSKDLSLNAMISSITESIKKILESAPTKSNIKVFEKDKKFLDPFKSLREVNVFRFSKLFYANLVVKVVYVDKGKKIVK